MLKPIIRKDESDIPPKDVSLKYDIKKKSASFVPYIEPVYPPVDSFDINNLAASGISPEAISVPFIDSSIDDFDSGLDSVNNAIIDNEIVS